MAFLRMSLSSSRKNGWFSSFFVANSLHIFRMAPEAPLVALRMRKGGAVAQPEYWAELVVETVGGGRWRG